VAWFFSVRMRVNIIGTNLIEVGRMKQKILLLDDSPFMLTTIGDMLKRLNYEVTAVDNGKDACKKINTSGLVSRFHISFT